MKNKNNNGNNNDDNNCNNGNNIRFFSFKKIFISLIAVLALLLGVDATYKVMAAGSSFQIPTTNKYEVYHNGDDYTPDYSSYPFTTSAAVSVGFDSLYGVNKELLTYLGEIPKTLADSNEDFEKYRTFDGDEIDGKTRKWSSETNQEDLVTEANSKAVKDGKLNPNTREPHIWAMTIHHSYFGGGIFHILFYLVYIFNWVITKIVFLMIFIKSIDLASLASMIDPSGGFTKQLASIFLINPDTGSVSPLLVFGIVVFIASFISLGFKVAKGSSNQSFRALINEFGFFLLAIVIEAIFSQIHDLILLLFF